MVPLQLSSPPVGVIDSDDEESSAAAAAFAPSAFAFSSQAAEHTAPSSSAADSSYLPPLPLSGASDEFYGRPASAAGGDVDSDSDSGLDDLDHALNAAAAARASVPATAEASEQQLYRIEPGTVSSLFSRPSDHAQQQHQEAQFDADVPLQHDHHDGGFGAAAAAAAAPPPVGAASSSSSSVWPDLQFNAASFAFDANATEVHKSADETPVAAHFPELA
jgi:hypothetical protein